MPESGSGVMLVPYTVPKGVSSGRPPADDRPPTAVWHTWQLPSAESCAPLATSAGSKALFAGTAAGGTGSSAHEAHAHARIAGITKARIGTLVYYRPREISSFEGTPFAASRA